MRGRLTARRPTPERPDDTEDAVYPEDLKYTTDHEWVRVLSDTTVRFGITEYAQDALGDIVYVSLPDVGAAVSVGDACGEVESTKSVSDLYAPVTGSVTARNDALSATPEVINADPYGEGWMVEIELSGGADQLATLLDSTGYAAHVAAG